MNRSFILKTTSFLTAIVVMVGMSGCHINSPGTKDYVDSVNNDMLLVVNNTRKLKEQQEKLDTRSPDDAKDYMQTLNILDDEYTDLIRLDSPEAYRELDDDIKENASQALSYIKELESLVTTSVNTADDFLYKQDCPHIMEQYEKCYTELVDLSAQVTTKYRND